MDVGQYAAFVGAVVVICVAPGPDMMFVLANTMASGRAAGLAAAVGMSAGLVVHTLAAVAGLSALLLAAPTMLAVVRWAGVLFLVYLAYAAWRHSGDGPTTQDVPTEPLSLRRVFVLGALTNLANPKVIVFYLAFFPQFLSGGTGSWPVGAQLAALGLTFIVVGLVVDSAVAVGVGALSRGMLRRRTVRRWLDRAAGTIFVALAVRLALQGP